MCVAQEQEGRPKSWPKASLHPSASPELGFNSQGRNGAELRAREDVASGTVLRCPGRCQRSAGLDFFGIGHFNHGSASQEAFKIAVKCPNWPNFSRLRRAEKGFARVGLPKSRQSVTLSLTVRSPNTITPVSWRVGALEPWGLKAAVQSNLEIFILAPTCSGARFFYLGGSATCETRGAAATPTGCLFAERFRERVYLRTGSERESISDLILREGLFPDPSPGPTTRPLRGRQVTKFEPFWIVNSTLNSNSPAARRLP